MVKNSTVITRRHPTLNGIVPVASTEATTKKDIAPVQKAPTLTGLAPVKSVQQVIIGSARESTCRYSFVKPETTDVFSSKSARSR